MKRCTLLCSLFLLSLLLPCCKKGHETKRFLLSENERAMFPCEKNDTVWMQHSGGFVFPLAVDQKTISLERSDSEHRADNYISYELLNIQLRSLAPDWLIGISLAPESVSYYSTVSFNRQLFPFDYSYLPVLESLTIDGVNYQGVYCLVNAWPQSDRIEADTIFLNSISGVLKISMSNGEFYKLH